MCKGDPYCSSRVSPVKFGHEFINLTNETMSYQYLFFDHMAAAAALGGCEYIIYFEEDVWLQRALNASEFPTADAGGILNPWYPQFSPRLQQEW